MKKQRYRIYFSKAPQMRYTSHLDLILTWERVFRRADLPLAYSEGFSPRPVLNLAVPLALGYISTGEIGDFWLSELIDLDSFLTSINDALPPGILINEVLEISDIHAPKLPSLVRSVSYIMELDKLQADLRKKIAGLLETNKLIRTRKKKEYDLRPLIQKLSLNKAEEGKQEIWTTLTALPGATGRPDEVLAALNIPPESARICRTEIILDQNGGR